jgi:hypothetical protein
MEYIDTSAVEQLLAERKTPKVTIYLPIHTSASPPHLTENQIRLKNLIMSAIDQLPKHGTGKQLSDELNTALATLSDDLRFWRVQTPGLLICASPGRQSMFHLAIDTEPMVEVNDQYHLAPILGLLSDTKHFSVLALAQQGPRLYEGDLNHIDSSAIELPESAETALGIDEGNQRTERQGSARGPSTRTSWFNGRGGARSPEPADRERYFRQIDTILNQKLNRGTPLLLAGTESDLALYRRISRYPKILASELEGNYITVQPHVLHGKASALVWRELIEPEHQAAIHHFERLRGSATDQTATDQKTIREAAGMGRVETLLANLLRRTSDTVQDSLHDVLRITFPPAELRESINQLALDVWRSHGRVLCLVPQEMPVKGTLAASLRY